MEEVMGEAKEEEMVEEMVEEMALEMVGVKDEAMVEETGEEMVGAEMEVGIWQRDGRRDGKDGEGRATEKKELEDKMAVLEK